ncbi:MAG TPA: hypothetical protein VFX96_10115 [Pyrinomonadaceae bacterium]|nr:hypothetical protein [Pyrinomonadaceae bacterium]
MSKSRRARFGAACLLVAGAAAVPSPSAETTAATPDAAQERRITRPVVEQRRFDVEVLVGGSPLAEFYLRGRTYVEALRGEEYELFLRNPLPVRVAVALSVDGLNTIDARRTSSWDASKWVIPPYGTIRVSGWQMSTERARRFYFTSESDSYAARLGRTQDLGNITAVFYRETADETTDIVPPPYRPQPRGEDRRERAESGESEAKSRSAARDGASASNRAPAPDDDYAATGIGRSVSHHVRRIHMNLERRPAAQVALRYEFRPALVRLGVLPRPRPERDTLPRRERSRGFEDSDFSPEP